MNKLLLVAGMTYRQRVRSGTFLILTLGLPLLMVAASAWPWLRSQSQTQPRLGYIDETGRLPAVDEGALGPARYADVAAAHTAYARGEIEGYLVVPPGYWDGEAVTIYVRERPGPRVEEALAAWLRRSLVPGRPAWFYDRMAEASWVTFVDADEGTQVHEGLPVVIRFALPTVLALLFALTVFAGVGQMGAAVVREKDQRAMEIVITSLRPEELVAGKVLGMTLVSLTQLALWVLGGGVAAWLALLGRIEPGQLRIPWGAVAWAVALGVPGYLLYAVLAAGLGLIAGNAQQAQQLAGVLGFVGMFPLWFVGLLLGAPNGPLAVGLTLFPLTGPMIGLLRMSLTAVPTWQLGAALGMILLSLAAGVWAVARLLRTAMLLYGQALRPRQVFHALRRSVG